MATRLSLGLAKICPLSKMMGSMRYIVVKKLHFALLRERDPRIASPETARRRGDAATRLYHFPLCMSDCYILCFGRRDSHSSYSDKVFVSGPTPVTARMLSFSKQTHRPSSARTLSFNLKPNMSHIQTRCPRSGNPARLSFSWYGSSKGVCSGKDNGWGLGCTEGGTNSDVYLEAWRSMFQPQCHLS